MRGFDWRSKLAVRGHPRVRISLLENGRPAKVVGRIIAESTVRSPIFGRPCVGYGIEGKLGGRSAPVVCEERLYDFILDDGTGQVIVRPGKNGVLILENWRETKLGLFRGTPEPNALEFFRRHNIETHGYYAYVREAVIEPGQIIVVFGIAEELGPDQGPYRRTAIFSPTEPVVIMDDLSYGQ